MKGIYMKLSNLFLSALIIASLGLGCHGGNNESNNVAAIQTPKTTYGFFRNLQQKTGIKTQEIMNSQAIGNPSITMATAREGHKAIAIGNGKFMLIGGERIVAANGQDLPSSDPSVIDIFDSNTEQFTHLSTVTNLSRQWDSAGINNFAMVQMPNNKILIIGGAKNSISETIEVFDPSDNSIQLITGVFPEGSINNVDHAFYIGNNKVLLVGTYFVDNGLHNKGNAVIDLTTMTGSFINTPYNAINGNAVQLSDRSVIYAGGNDPTIGTNFYSDIYRIDPNTLETTKSGNMLFPRNHFGMTVLPNGNIGIYGGIAHINATFGQDEVLRYKSVEIINTTTWIPSLSVDLLGYRSMTLPTVLQTGNVLVAGGVNEIGRPADSEFVHNSESNISAFTGNLNIPRSFYSVISLNNGRVLISGGLSDIGATNTAEIYDPAAKLLVTYDTSTTIPISTNITPSIVHFTSTGTGVTWSVSGNGTIDINGVYTAPTSPSVDVITGNNGTNSTQVTITSIE
jgi:hypothetical protein